jgi:Secretion system C-terminal sorting domain
LGVDFDHRSYVWEGGADTGFYIHEYRMQNTGANTISNLFTGFYADPDVSSGGANDIVAWDSTTRMAYVKSTDSAFSTAGGPYFGIALLTQNTPRNFSGLVNDGTSGPFNVYDGFSDAEHLQSLNRGVVSQTLPPVGRKDVSLSIGYGPLTLGSQEIRLGYAMCVGYSFQALQKAALRADSLYTAIVTSSKPATTPQSVQITPNPAKDVLEVRIPADATVFVVNLQGRRMALPISQTGSRAVLNVRDLPNGVYAVAVQSSKGTVVRRFVKE